MGKLSTYPGTPLRRGSTGADVTRLQGKLHDGWGWEQLDVDGDFGPATEHAVNVWKDHHNMPMDGQAGPNAWAGIFGEDVYELPVNLRAFDAAEELLGTLEQGGNNRGPVVSKIIAANHGGVAVVEPWCGDFVAYCYRQADSKLADQKSPSMWAYVPFISNIVGIQRTRNPVRGDIVRFQWDAGVPDHTGLFDRWEIEGVSFRTIEGNTGKDPNVSDSSAGGDGVHRRARGMSVVYDFLHVTK